MKLVIFALFKKENVKSLKSRKVALPNNTPTDLIKLNLSKTRDAISYKHIICVENYEGLINTYTNNLIRKYFQVCMYSL